MTARCSSTWAYPGNRRWDPTAFMHRLSGMDNPEAPLAHHWLDSTHVSWGVATAGYTWQGVKLEASAFNGREPDQFHYNIQTGSLDSYALRATLNPTASLSMQASFGRLISPEQLEPGIDIKRSTVSVTYNAPLALLVANDRRLRPQQPDGRFRHQWLAARVGGKARRRAHALRPLRAGRQG